MSGDKLTLSLTVLLTGFAVVFVVLLLLIGIIKLYGTIIYNIQNEGHKKKKDTKPVKVASVPDKVMEPVAAVEAHGVGDSGHGVYLLFDSEAVCHRPVPVAAAGFPGGVVMFALSPGQVNGYVCQDAFLFQSCASSASCRANSSMIS